ncbi:hypothetical protein ES703_78997 [subsurface metagenome]
MNTFYFLVKRGVINIPLRHFPKTHYSVIPVFQSRLGGMSEANYTQRHKYLRTRYHLFAEK